MSVQDTIKRVVLTDYRADNSNQIRAIEQLIAKQQQLAAAATATAQSQAQHFDELVLGLTRSNQAAEQGAMSWDGLTKQKRSFTAALGDAIGGVQSFVNKLAPWNQALELGGKAARFASEAIKEWAETTRLESKTAGIDIDALSNAFNGLINHHDLLKFAAQTSTGVLALNQQEMEKVAQAAVALRGRGHDLEDSFRKLTDAVVKGTVGGLDDLGLEIQEGDSKAQTLKNTLAELDKVIKESDPTYEQAGDAVQRVGVAWDDATAAAKRYAAEALVAIATPLPIVEQLKEVDKLVKAGLSQDDAWAEIRGRMEARAAAPAPTSNAAAKNQAELDARKAAMGVIEMPDDDRSGDVEKLRNDRKRNAEQALRELERELAEDARERADIIQQEFAEANELALERMRQDASTNALAGAHQTVFDSMTQITPMDLSALDESFDRIAEAADARTAELYDQFNERRNKSLFEAAFGPLDEIDLHKEALEQLASTFEAFGEAVAGSYEAIITGQGSASAAFKKLMADGLMAIGKSSVVEALRETALGFGALAFGSPTAALHFKSAAMHGAVAVAAGLAAGALGTSSQVSAQEAAEKEKAREEEKARKERERAAGGDGGGSGSGRGNDTVIVAYLDPFANQPEHVRRQQAREMVHNVLGTGAVEYS